MLFEYDFIFIYERLNELKMIFSVKTGYINTNEIIILNWIIDGYKH